MDDDSVIKKTIICTMFNAMHKLNKLDSSITSPLQKKKMDLTGNQETHLTCQESWSHPEGACWKYSPGFAQTITTISAVFDTGDWSLGRI